MAFSLTSWRTQAAEWLKKFAKDREKTEKDLRATTVLGVCIGAALAPMAEALTTPEALAALGEAGKLLGTMGAGALGSMVHQWWSEKKDPEKDLAAQPELREVIDRLLDELGVIGAAQEALAQEWDEVRPQLEQSARRLGLGAVSNSLQIVVTGPFRDLYVIYQSTAGSHDLEKPAYDAILKRYLELTYADHSRVQLHGRQVLGGGGPLTPKRLERVYTSLRATHRSGEPVETAAQKARAEEALEAERGDGRGAETDMRDLLTLGPNLAIVGGAGSGKSTYVSALAAALARAHLDRAPVDDRVLRLAPEDLPPLPVVLPLRYWNVYRQSTSGDRRLKAREPRAGTFADFLPWFAASRYDDLRDVRDFFHHMLKAESCLLMLDGIDEIVDAEERRTLRDAVLDFVQVQYPGNRCLVTGRPPGHRDAPFDEVFARCEILPMSEEDMAALTRAWCGELYPHEGDRQLAEREIVAGIATLNGRREEEQQEPFISTPLLVNMVVSVRYSNNQLPEDRVRLYDASVDVILRSLQAGARDTHGALKAVVEFPGPPDKQREWTRALAHHMHTRGQAGALIDEDGVRECLGRLLDDQGESRDLLDQFIGAVRMRDGLLEARGDQFQFMHLTFQEFLAGEYLTEWDFEDEVTRERLARLVTDEWWREALLLCIGRFDAFKRRQTMIEALCEGMGRHRKAALPAAEIAARGLLDLRSPAPVLKEHVANRIRELMAKPTYLDLSPAAVKARAAGALNSLPGGDTRPGVACRAGHPDLPDIQWCPVPKGTFMMGSSRDDGDADSDEHGPEGEPFVVQVGAFDLAAYPMTVAQFEPFVEGDGYSNAEYWTDSGLEWLGGREEKQPYLWDDPEWNGRNQPVVGVSWYEAVAYCNWLTKRLDEAGELEDGRPVRLPTEEEWEYAARGPKGWKYPWGDKWNGNACNNEAAGIGTTCAVGLFPSGISQWLAEQDQIVHDLAGNVYEWCATKWRKSYEEKADESLSGDALRVIRGGAYFSSTGSVRCAYRYWDPPGEHGYGLLGFRCAR